MARIKTSVKRVCTQKERKEERKVSVEATKYKKKVGSEIVTKV